MLADLHLDHAKLALFCRERHVKRLGVFGSALRADFRPDSDVDVLIEFDPEHLPKLYWGQWVDLDRLAALFGARRIDLVESSNIKPRLRRPILGQAIEVYPRAGEPWDPTLASEVSAMTNQPTKTDLVYLDDMLEHINAVAEMTQGKSRSDLETDRTLRLAVLHALQITGEAAGKVSPDFADARTEVPSRNITGSRHRIVLDYRAVDLDTVWGIVTTEIEPLREQLATIVDANPIE